MFGKPVKQHEWLHQLIGKWDFTHNCVGPDQSTSTTRGQADVSSLGGLWVLIHCTGDAPEGEGWNSIFQLGYDPDRSLFVGSFIASMMPSLWVYEGALDSTEKVLTLDVEGPAFDGSGMAKYQDIFEIDGSDLWHLRSRIQTPDGNWVQFLNGEHRRVAEH